jgi:hypothetical protein
MVLQQLRDARRCLRRLKFGLKPHSMAATSARQALRRWGNSLGIRLSLAERLAAYEPMADEPTEAMAFRPLGAEVIE